MKGRHLSQKGVSAGGRALYTISHPILSHMNICMRTSAYERSPTQTFCSRNFSIRIFFLRILTNFTNFCYSVTNFCFRTFSFPNFFSLRRYLSTLDSDTNNLVSINFFQYELYPMRASAYELLLTIFSIRTHLRSGRRDMGHRPSKAKMVKMPQN